MFLAWSVLLPCLVNLCSPIEKVWSMHHCTMTEPAASVAMIFHCHWLPEHLACLPETSQLHQPMGVRD